MNMGVSFQYLMGTGTDMSVVFKNRYRYEYSSIHPEAVPLPFLETFKEGRDHTVAIGYLATGWTMIVLSSFKIAKTS